MHNQPLIIGFGYRARNGKDTAVNHLINTYGAKYDIRRYAFGDLLKCEVFDALQNWRHPFWDEASAQYNYLALPHPMSEFFDTTIRTADKVAWIDANKTDPQLAKLLQTWGTEYRRARDPFYWVKALRQQIMTERPQIALISDMRFRNEFSFVAGSRGYTVKVTRHGFELNDGRSTTHVSETELDGIKFHFEIEVLDGELDQLKKDAETVFDMIIAAVNPVSEASLV